MNYLQQHAASSRHDATKRATEHDDNDPRVFITGAGVVSPLGNTSRTRAGPRLTESRTRRSRASTARIRDAIRVRGEGLHDQGVIDRKAAAYGSLVSIGRGHARGAAGRRDWASIDPTPDRIGVVVGAALVDGQSGTALDPAPEGPPPREPVFIPMMISDMAPDRCSSRSTQGRLLHVRPAPRRPCHGESLRLLRAGDADVIPRWRRSHRHAHGGGRLRPTMRHCPHETTTPARGRPLTSGRTVRDRRGSRMLVLETEAHAKRAGPRRSASWPATVPR